MSIVASTSKATAADDAACETGVSFCPCHAKPHESKILAVFAFSFYAIYGSLNPTLMLKPSINFPSVPFCSQRFRPEHHQKSIKEYLHYCAFPLLVV
ncbi:MAG: hypothetical protein J6K64_08670 [Clostridia bacterium]|nr:hypothetical protein [Clostridia bacterium]